MGILSVREIRKSDIPLITDYWLLSDPGLMTGMGVQLDKLPSREQWDDMLSTQLMQSYEEKQSYCMIWEIDGMPVGHCNVNKIRFGEEAYMHLHLWQATHRHRGAGSALVKMTLPYFFKNLKLKTLYCEPYALNTAPNKTLSGIGFRMLQEYTTTPGFVCFEQPVRLWVLTEAEFRGMA
ncbi:GNAT family N-acetyltransferase [Taibaiella koreensis]|uniref:GNAT family N-acetyltransferase n=1 Tax=Taibaiella koreensis TaxID=1268548 RepID=UPI000E5994D5|nr:GNAT family protein [Taibaiella koreensis]